MVVSKETVTSYWKYQSAVVTELQGSVVTDYRKYDTEVQRYIRTVKDAFLK